MKTFEKQKYKKFKKSFCIFDDLISNTSGTSVACLDAF